MPLPTQADVDRVAQIGREHLASARATGEQWLAQIAPAIAGYVVLQKAGDLSADRVLSHLYAQSRAIGYLIQIDGESAGLDAAQFVFQIATKALL